jgi:putative N6-adenine-specific DNA methylase
LNSSGMSLHKRGYRIRQGEAPLNEILAAAIVMSSNYDCRSTFFDPMCGSGTLITEAMLIAAQCPPQYQRKHFAFMNWSGFHAKTWNTVYEDAMKHCVDIESDFFACDIDPEALSTTKQNVENLGIKHALNIRKRSFFDTESAPSNSGILICNPPYGERLKLENMIQFYKNMGDVLKAKFTNWDAWVFSGNWNALKHLGLKTSKKITFYNGAIPSKLQKYSLY